MPVFMIWKVFSRNELEGMLRCNAISRNVKTAFHIVVYGAFQVRTGISGGWCAFWSGSCAVRWFAAAAGGDAWFRRSGLAAC
jgi:hypothetical protein